MLRFSDNLSTMFWEYPMLECPVRAASAGFGCAEIHFPFYLDPEDLNIQLAGNGLKLLVLNLPAGDPPQGGEGNATMPKKTRRIPWRRGALRAFCRNSAPSRHEPGSGNMNFEALLTAIRAS